MEAQKAYIKSIFKKLSDYTRSKTPKGMECLNAILSNVRTLKERAEDFFKKKTQYVKEYASECDINEI
uniref:Transposase n=1 Tax=Strongyloides venezuelensis TaxID=75913 RepID=A0A0K0FRV5_STRVS